MSSGHFWVKQVSLAIVFQLVLLSTIDAEEWKQNPTNGHFYRLTAIGNWIEAQQEAELLDGYLVTIDDAAENAWLVTTFQPTLANCWIGLTDVTTEGSFDWANGAPLSYTNWNPGEPNNQGSPQFGGEDYVYMFTQGNINGAVPGTWNDVNFVEGAGSGLHGIMERETRPESGWHRNPNNGHYYKVIETSNWYQGRDRAIALGGYLASITDALENGWLVDTFIEIGSFELFWIGLTDETIEGTFEWLSGEPFSYSNWSPGNPDNLGEQDYGTFNQSAQIAHGLWDDADPNHEYRSIVERTSPPRVWFVDIDNISGMEDGLSWETAFVEIQDAIDAATSGDEIWVAEGVYDELRLSSPTGSVVLKPGIDLLGGFNGDECIPSERNPSVYSTIIDGSSARAGMLPAQHVVLGADYSVIDGFVITGGNADNSLGGDLGGGGMLNDGVSPTVSNVTFFANSAALRGGAMDNRNSAAPYIVDCWFIENGVYDDPAGGAGGAINNKQTGLVAIDRCYFLRNFASNTMTGNGGAIFNEGTIDDPQITNCVFVENETTGNGGAIHNQTSNPVILNSTFTLNNATAGGAINAHMGSSVVIINSIAWGDVPNELNVEGTGSFTVTFSNIEDGIAGTGNIIPPSDPLFVAQTPADVRLSASSPSIDSADAASSPPIDIEGVTRPQGNGVDMGAYESTGDNFSGCYYESVFQSEWPLLAADLNLKGNITETPGKRIPERWGLAMVEKVLCNPKHPHHEAAKDAYENNLSILAAETNFPMIEVYAHVVAGLLVVNQQRQDHLKSLLGLTNNGYEIARDNGAARAFGDELFGDDADLDSDGLTNADEYDAVLLNGGNLDDFVEVVGAALPPVPLRLTLALWIFLFGVTSILLARRRIAPEK